MSHKPVEIGGYFYAKKYVSVTENQLYELYTMKNYDFYRFCTAILPALFLFRLQ